MEKPGVHQQQPQVDPIISQIEAGKSRLLNSEGFVSDMPGTAGPFDDQSIKKAVGGSKNRLNCQYLYDAAKQYGSGGVVELGTNVGISSAYLTAGALQSGGSPKVVTGDVSGKRIGIAKDLHRQCGLTNVEYVEGYFEQTAEHIFNRVPGWTLAFIDGDHTYDGTLRYYDLVRKKARPGCVVIFDDIEWSDQMRRAWVEINKIHKGQISAKDGMGTVWF